jgi:hypothetical protein
MLQHHFDGLADISKTAMHTSGLADAQQEARKALQLVPVFGALLRSYIHRYQISPYAASNHTQQAAFDPRSQSLPTAVLDTPACFSTAAMLPSVMLSPMAGTTTSAAAGTLVCKPRTRLV